MKLTPLDIRRNEFSRAMRGFNREEVESFLTMVADEVEGLIGEHRELARRVGELQKEIDEYRNLERTLMDTLVSAQKAADEMRESSQRESEVILREAHVRAEQAVDAARIEAERLLMEARHNAHTVLEDARHTAHQALEAARRQAEQITDVARQEAVAIRNEVKALIERRAAFMAGLRAFLNGQIDALAVLEGEKPPPTEPLPGRDAPVVTDEEAEALAALDRELAQFAADTAPPTDDLAPPGGTSEPTEATPPASSEGASGEGSEVLIDRRRKGKS